MKLFRLTTVVFYLLLCQNTWADDAIAYPKDYRSWSHVKSLILRNNHPLANPFAGIHHVYANAKAVSGLRQGNFKDGASLVFDLLQNQESGNANSEGDRILLGVMVKDRKKFSATGGWGFEAFKGNSQSQRLTSDGGQSCYGCHTSQQHNDYVFSHWRE